MKMLAGKIVGIDGRRPEREIVKQAILRELETLQRVAWIANRQVALLSERIKTAIRQGAAVEPGPLYWDARLEMTRTRKTGT